MTNRGGVVASAHNRDIAAQQVQRCEQAIERAEAGEVTSEMRCELSRFKAEFEHWANYVGYYKERALREGADTVVHMMAGMSPAPRQAQATQPQRPPVRDQRLPREPGDDSDEEVPF